MVAITNDKWFTLFPLASEHNDNAVYVLVRVLGEANWNVKNQFPKTVFTYDRSYLSSSVSKKKLEFTPSETCWQVSTTKVGVMVLRFSMKLRSRRQEISVPSFGGLKGSSSCDTYYA